MMRLLLRLIAVFAGISVFLTLWFMIQFGASGWSALAGSGALGVVTMAGWIVTLIAGPVAAVQLFRLRRSGRLAAIVMFASTLLYYVAGLIGLRSADAPVAPIIAACTIFGTIVAILLTPAAHRTCVAAEVTDRLVNGG